MVQGQVERSVSYKDKYVHRPLVALNTLRMRFPLLPQVPKDEREVRKGYSGMFPVL